MVGESRASEWFGDVVLGLTRDLVILGMLLRVLVTSVLHVRVL